MAHISRPFQIALVALGLFVAVWVFALRSHSSSSSSSSESATTPARPAAKPAHAAAPKGSSSSSIYHGAAPGVQGLTRAIAKAHGAVATSQQNAQQLSERSEQASSATSSTSASAPASTPTTGSAAHTPSTSSASTPGTHPAAKTQVGKGRSGVVHTPTRQPAVERALHEGKVAVILFWSPRGSDDKVVREELRVLEALHHIVRSAPHTPKLRGELERSGLELQKSFAPFEAHASEVAAFGTITRGVQVYSTPTMLIVGKGGKTTVITGLTDALAIEQAIDETRHAEP